MTKNPHFWIAGILVSFSLAIVGFIVIMGLFTGEYLCSGRHPWWGPPESGADDSCAGYIYEGRRERGH